jgi:glycosyltransferase involved in cell wall biosynthesis
MNKLTIAIPTYNRAAKISKSIESVLSQDLKDFELIICDNNSKDNTEKVVNGYNDERIKYFYFDNQVSMYENHNRCVNLASTEWLVFLHSDDTLEKNALSQIISIIKNHPDIDMISPSVRHLSLCRNLITQPNGLLTSKAVWAILAIDGFTPNGCCFQTKSFQNYGYFNDSSPLADGELQISWLMQGSKILLSTDNWTVHLQDVESGFSKLAKTVNYYKSHVGLFDTFFSHEIKDEELREIALFLMQVPSSVQARFLRRCYQAKYEQQASFIEEILSKKDSNFKLSQEYQHIVLWKISPKIYWFALSVIKNLKKRKEKIYENLSMLK